MERSYTCTMWLMVSNCILYSLSCLTLCYPMKCSPPGSSVPVIYQLRITEWVAISFSRGSSRPRHWTCVSCIGRQVLYHWTTRKELVITTMAFYIQCIVTENNSKLADISMSVCVCVWLFKSYHQKNEVNISCQFYIRKIETIKWEIHTILLIEVLSASLNL